MLGRLLRLFVPPKPTVDGDHQNLLKEARTFAVQQKRESDHARRVIEAELQHREATGMAVIDMARGSYDPRHPLYRGEGRKP